jgi:hypothetical protein
MLLREVIETLGRTRDFDAAVAEVAARYADVPAPKRTRLLYQGLLARNPESAAAALRAPADFAAALRGVLLSDEFRNRSTDLLLAAFPEKARDLFIHIPKTGGITVTQRLADDPRSTTLYCAESLSTGWIRDWRGYLRSRAEKLIGGAERICVAGHLKAASVLARELNRENDQVFCVVREPVALMVSWVNYIVTTIARDPGGPAASSEVADWRRRLEIAERWSPDAPAELERVFFLILERLIGDNPVCVYLGLASTAESAVEMIHRLGIGVVEMRRVEAFLAERGLSAGDHKNVSEKFFAPASLSAPMRQAVLDKIPEDMMLWRYMIPTLARSAAPMIDSHHFAATIESGGAALDRRAAAG